MQKLHLVGLTTDLNGLIFSARKGSKSGSFVVPVDARLLAVIADTISRRDGEAPSDAESAGAAPESAESAAAAARPLRAPSPPRPSSALSPREIQARLRAGRTVDEVAKEAGVDVEWVERFAVPIRAEQGRIVEQAFRLHFLKPRVGTSALPLAASVRRNVLDKGVRLADDEFDGGWSAYHLEDVRWVVRFTYRSRNRAQTAEWELDLDAEGTTLTARNRLAGQLGHVPSARRRPRPIVASPPKKRAAKRAGKKTASTKKSSAAKKGATMKRAPARASTRTRSTRSSR